MSAPQNTIAIVYDYDQTLSPSHMQDEVIFPAFAIDGLKSWTRCSELVRDHGYDNVRTHTCTCSSSKLPTALSSSASLPLTPAPFVRRNIKSRRRHSFSDQLRD
ncbi:MAG: hypothetical protein DME30_00055 [Verrucomicrobia bacterium]|nr:MAG: hypothetical protein DME30_00055 [Verrucomicrobiota bacterium]